MALVLTDFKHGDQTGNAPGIHCYTTPDNQATINTAGYFNNLSATLDVGDLIYIWAVNAGTQVAILTQVLSNAGGVVDVADGTVLAATDTD
ncbi:hypothetical protein [Pseudoalteromonas marina]|uniref:hypothetical protein n=1 Tax=Pseudoalteromonas marina TaxID=267375 RepID=UPI003C673448